MKSDIRVETHDNIIFNEIWRGSLRTKIIFKHLNYIQTFKAISKHVEQVQHIRHNFKTRKAILDHLKWV